MGSRRFLTERLPAERRVQAWEGHNEKALVGLRCRLLRDDFVAEEINREVGQVHVAEVKATPHAVERTAEVIEKAPGEAVLLYLTLAGESFFYHSAGVLVTRPGQVVVCDADQPFMRGFSHGLRELVVKVPKALWGRGAEPLAAPVLLGPRGVGVGALREGVRRLAAQTPERSATAELEEALGLVELASSLASGESRPDSPAAAQLQMAQHYIAEHLRDASLTATQIAAGVGISERQLSRVFSAAGLSVPSWISSRRVQLAHRLMEHPDFDRPVPEVAAMVGFGSYGGFARAFRAQTGMAPREVRRIRRG